MAKKLLRMNLRKYHIPYNGHENIPDEIYHTIHLIQKYLVN
mgnify:CR=1 FL=1